MGKSYLGKQQELGVLSLNARRLRFALVLTFKIIEGFDNVNRDIWFDLVEPDNPRPTRLTRLTYNQYNIIPKCSRTDPRLHFFSNRVVNSWNALPTEIKDAKSLKMFKNTRLKFYKSSLCLLKFFLYVAF